MTRIPKIAHDVHTNRTIATTEIPNLDAPIAWNFKRMDKGGKFKCDFKSLHNHETAVLNLEGKTIKQLMEKNHNHPLAIDKLSPVAKARMRVLNLDIETIYQLDLRTPARLWGILEHNIFHVIWLDPNHLVYPSR